MNKVACPTKLIEYLEHGIIPIVLQPEIGDFNKMGYRYILNDDFLEGKIPNHDVLEQMKIENYKIVETLKIEKETAINTLEKLFFMPSPIKRIAIFAHFDSRNRIDNYVKYYIEGLKKVADTIIFVSDGYLFDSEQLKIKHVTDKIIAARHGEYDFGSYKRGFLYAKEYGLLEGVEEVIFANDSCYGPIYPFNQMFNLMSFVGADFWGITQNKFAIKKVGGQYKTDMNAHLQSYFLVFKKQVFLSDIFCQFIKNIKKEDYKEDIIINYEINLTRMLVDHGYQYDFYIKNFLDTNNPAIRCWDKIMVEEKGPLLKTSVLQLKNIDILFPFNWGALLKTINPLLFNTIHHHLKQCKNRKKIMYKNGFVVLTYFIKKIIRLERIFQEKKRV